MVKVEFQKTNFGSRTKLLGKQKTSIKAQIKIICRLN